MSDWSEKQRSGRVVKNITYRIETGMTEDVIPVFCMLLLLTKENMFDRMFKEQLFTVSAYEP